MIQVLWFGFEIWLRRLTVDRYVANVISPVYKDTKGTEELRKAIYNLSILPSMRAMMTAGKAADRDNTCMYNCAFRAVDSIDAFAEAAYVLMCGTGFGYSVEKKYVEKLPVVPKLESVSHGTFVIEYNKPGWANSIM